MNNRERFQQSDSDDVNVVSVLDIIKQPKGLTTLTTKYCHAATQCSITCLAFNFYTISIRCCNLLAGPRWLIGYSSIVTVSIQFFSLSILWQSVVNCSRSPHPFHIFIKSLFLLLFLSKCQVTITWISMRAPKPVKSAKLHVGGT